MNHGKPLHEMLLLVNHAFISIGLEQGDFREYCGWSPKEMGIDQSTSESLNSQVKTDALESHQSEEF